MQDHAIGVLQKEYLNSDGQQFHLDINNMNDPLFP
jgi:hypothetical protein